MKKSFLFVLGFILLCSCSSSDSFDGAEEVPVKSEEVSRAGELSSIQFQINSLNHEMFPESGQTRGFWKFLKRIYSVVIGDAVGGLFGTLVGGPGGAVAGAAAGSGIMAFSNTDRINLKLMPSLSAMNDGSDIAYAPTLKPGSPIVDSLIVPKPKPGQTYTLKDSIGYYHNVILADLSNTLKKSDASVDSVLTHVATTTSKYYKESASSILTHLKARRGFFNGIMNIKDTELEKCNSLHEIFAVWKKQNPGNDKELDVLEEFFNGIVKINIDESDGKFLNRALDIVDNSALDAATKENLRNAFIVGNASYHLWSTNEQ